MDDTTSDGISKIEWNKIEYLASKIVADAFSDDDILYKKHTEEILYELDILQNKYGELPSILATKADYVDDCKQELILLKKAYEIARSIMDTKNLTYISSSLAQRYVEKFEDKDNGKFWLNEFKKSLIGYFDQCESEEYTRLVKLYNEKETGPKEKGVDPKKQKGTGQK